MNSRKNRPTLNLRVEGSIPSRLTIQNLKTIAVFPGERRFSPGAVAVRAATVPVGRPQFRQGLPGF
jgi:hypothetical protein